MIYIDVDGVCIDFIGTAKKFGIELKPNEFVANILSAPTPPRFYAQADLQKWFSELLLWVLVTGEKPNFITKDYAVIKQIFISRKMILSDCDCEPFEKYFFVEAANKSEHCRHPFDVLIDDNAAECEAWRNKGGIAYHFDLADEKPFEKFLQWWNLKGGGE